MNLQRSDLHMNYVYFATKPSSHEQKDKSVDGQQLIVPFVYLIADEDVLDDDLIRECYMIWDQILNLAKMIFEH